MCRAEVIRKHQRSAQCHVEAGRSGSGAQIVGCATKAYLPPVVVPERFALRDAEVVLAQGYVVSHVTLREQAQMIFASAGQTMMREDQQAHRLGDRPFSRLKSEVHRLVGPPVELQQSGYGLLAGRVDVLGLERTKLLDEVCVL